MADTQRTRAALLALMADNVTGQISPQDFRDFIVTVMPAEFVYSDDFFTGVTPANVTTDQTTRGFHIYSQTMCASHSASFGMPLAYNETSGTWSPADTSMSCRNPARGIPADSYPSAATNVKILLKGIVYDTALGTRLSDYIGKPVFLQSAAGSDTASIDCVAGDIDSTLGIIGRVLGSTVGAGIGGSTFKWYFDGTGNWAVTGT